MRRPFAVLVLAISLLPVAALAESFVVLPFFNSSKNPKVDWVGESIAEAVRDALSGHGILVLERESLKEAYRRLALRPNAEMTRATVIKIAEALDADQILFGQFEVLPATAPGGKESLRLTARILDLGGMKQFPEFSETGAFDELAAVQEHLAWQTLRVSVPASVPSEEEFRRLHPPVRVDAIENYIRGLLATSTEQKHRFLTQAARLDPSYAEPNFELGRLLWTQENFGAAEEWFRKVPARFPHYREANFFLGLCRFYTGDYTGAQIAFDLVAQSVPLNEVFNNLGAAQSLRDRPEALENFRKALEGDQADPDYHFNIGYALWKRGEFDAAAESFRATLARDPQDAEATKMLGRCLKKTQYRANDPNDEPLERVKETYNERVYWQLKAALEPKK
jgi:tetratricopeptide (TPR) repeat protein